MELNAFIIIIIILKKKFELYLSSNDIKSANFMSEYQYNIKVEEVESAYKKNSCKTSIDRRIKRYEIILCNGVKKLAVRRSSDNPDTIYFVHSVDIIEIIIHRMENFLKGKFKNIGRQEIMNKEQRDHKPMVFKHFNERCQVDLIDMQTCSDGEYRFIMVYQDHLTKYVILRHLKFKSAEEVTRVMVNSIFLFFGAPKVLQSDNGREFVNSIINNLCNTFVGMQLSMESLDTPKAKGVSNAPIKTWKTCSARI